MSITNLLFLFVFLPVSIGLYSISPGKAKEYVLLALSLAFYGLGSLQYFSFFICCVCLTVLLGRGMAAAQSKNLRRIFLILGIVLNAGALGWFKYANYIFYISSSGTSVSAINGGLQKLMQQSMVLPLGISFFTFKAISYLCDIYTGTAALSERPVRDCLYLTFFPQVQSGPLSRYNDMNVPDTAEMNTGSERFEGALQFVRGFNKKILLANVLANIVNEVFGTSFERFSTTYAWLGSIAFSLQLMYDFSGYSDMAIGLTRVFGYRCPKNFDNPYTSDSVAHFWKKWHITLGAWFRDYVYIPLGGSRSNTGRTVLNLLAVWLLTGIWHGASWNFIAWGLLYFLFITFEKLTGLPKKLKPSWSKGIYRVVVLLFINFQWVLFRADNLEKGLKFIRYMVVWTPNTIGNLRAAFLVGDYAPFLVFGLLWCLPVTAWVQKRLAKYPRAGFYFDMAETFVTLLLFVWAVSFVVAGRNNPFAYANF